MTVEQVVGRWSGHWHIVDQQTRKSLESHLTESRAVYGCTVVNEHEARNGRDPRRYAVEWRQAYQPEWKADWRRR